jgi:hypothetical protein
MEISDEIDVDTVIEERSLPEALRRDTTFDEEGGCQPCPTLMNRRHTSELTQGTGMSSAESDERSYAFLEPPLNDVMEKDPLKKCKSTKDTSCFEGKRKHAVIWLTFLLGLYVLVGTLLSVSLKNNTVETRRMERDRMDPEAREEGRTNSDLLGVDLSNSTAHRVLVGIYIDKITDHDIMESAWTADFYLWFKWNTSATTSADTNVTNQNSTETRRLKDSIRPNSNNNPTRDDNQAPPGVLLLASSLSSSESATISEELNPGETFQIIEGDLVSKTLLETKVSQPDNVTGLQTHYTLYKVQAKLTHFFDISRFPRDNHLQLVRIEDQVKDSNQLMYLPDTENSDISSRVYIHGYTIPSMDIIAKWHAYKNTRGDPFVSKGQTNFSQFLAGIYVLRPDWGLYWMMFQGVFASVGVAFLGIIIQNESRFDLGIGGFFACVAATYVSSALLPMAGDFSLTDYVHAVSLCTVLLTLVHIYMGKHIFKDSQERWFDFVGLAVFVAGYVGCIAGMSLAASPW